MGGIIKAIESGYPQREIAEAAYRYQKQVESGAKTIVGLNKYTMPDETSIPLLKIPPEVEEKQKARLAEVKRTRDGKAVSSALHALTAKCHTEENLMPAILDCVRAYCSVEETSDAMKEVFGEYRETSVF